MSKDKQSKITVVESIRLRGDKRRKVKNVLKKYKHLKNLMTIFLKYFFCKKHVPFFYEVIFNENVFNAYFSKPNSRRKEKVKRRLVLFRSLVENNPGIQNIVDQIRNIKSQVPNCVFQSVRQQTFQDFKSYLRLWKSFKSGKVSNPPNIPKPRKLDKFLSFGLTISQPHACRYVDTKNGQDVILIPWLGNIKVKLPRWLKFKDIKFITVSEKFDEVWIHIGVETEVLQTDLDNSLYLGIDLGIRNLASCVSNKSGHRSFIINGGPFKYFNQWYHKTFAKLQSDNNIKGLRQLARFRKRWFDNQFHKVANHIILECLRNGIKYIVVGNVYESKNQTVNLGRMQNQQFHSIPLKRLVDIIKYKAQKFGIEVIEVEESYTSKTSCISAPEPDAQYTNTGIRNGSLFKDTVLNKVFHADLNGAANIVKKVYQNAFSHLKRKEMFFKLCNPFKIRNSHMLHNLSLSLPLVLLEKQAASLTGCYPVG